jgi:hypothetical protein
LIFGLSVIDLKNKNYGTEKFSRKVD